MASKLNNNLSGSDNITSVISSEKFGEYDAELQKEILNKMDDSQKRDGGFMGKLFGNKKELASMNIALILCVLLLLTTAFVKSEQLWNGVLPVVGTALGYIFGKGGDKSE